MLSPRQQIVKRIFDICLAMLGLVATGWIIVLTALFARMDTGRGGFFRQLRVGREGRLFSILKIRTMRDSPSHATTVTTADDPRITRFGRLLRATKMDELPQLINVLIGDMSFVGPRPDVPEVAGQLTGVTSTILSVRPGITGPASLKYRREEQLLAAQEDPERFNQEVLFPDKVRINAQYVADYSFLGDLKYLWHTLMSSSMVVPSQTQPPEANDAKQAA